MPRPRKTPKKTVSPPVKKISLRLNCEWDECYACYETIEDLLDHLSFHLKQFLVEAADIVSNASADEEVSATCRWRECGCQLETSVPFISRHIYFHAFHAKIKCIGQTVLDSTSLSPCSLDGTGRNMIPELPESLTCGWENCGAVFDNPEYFYRHVDTHIEGFERGNKPDISVRCFWEGCQHVLKSRHKLKLHLRSHSQEKVVACPVCGGLFANNTKFTDHISRQSDTGNTYQCSHCNRRYSTERLLRDHMRHHVNHYKCPLCEMTCPSPSALKLHMRYRHTDYKPFECSQCGVSFKMVGDMNRHMDVVHTEGSYKCSADNCKFTARSFACLSKHFTAVHQIQKQTMYRCHLCKEEYTRGYILTRHLKTQHNFKWPSGHVRFRYKLQDDGYFSLQTVRYESLDVTAFDSEQSTSSSGELQQNDLQVIDETAEPPVDGVASPLSNQPTTTTNPLSIATLTAIMEGATSPQLVNQQAHGVSEAEQYIDMQNVNQTDGANSTISHQLEQLGGTIGGDNDGAAVQETYNLQMLGEVALHLPQSESPAKKKIGTNEPQSNTGLQLLTNSSHAVNTLENNTIPPASSVTADTTEINVIPRTSPKTTGPTETSGNGLLLSMPATETDAIPSTASGTTGPTQAPGNAFLLSMPTVESLRTSDITAGTRSGASPSRNKTKRATNSKASSLTESSVTSPDGRSEAVVKLKGAQKRKSPIKKRQAKRRKVQVEDEEDIEDTVTSLGITIVD